MLTAKEGSPANAEQCQNNKTAGLNLRNLRATGLKRQILFKSFKMFSIAQAINQLHLGI